MLPEREGGKGGGRQGCPCTLVMVDVIDGMLLGDPT